MQPNSNLIDLYQNLDSFQRMLLKFEARFLQHVSGKSAGLKIFDEQHEEISNELLDHDDTIRHTTPLVIYDSTAEKDINYHSFQDVANQPKSISVFAKKFKPYKILLDKDSLTLGSNATLYECLVAAAIVGRFPFLRFNDTQIVDRAVFNELEEIVHRKRYYLIQNIILSRKPSRALRFLDYIGLLDDLLPELTAGKGLTQNRFHAHDIYEHLLHAVDGVREANEIIRWSALLHDIGKVQTRKEKPNGEASFHNHEMFSAKQVVPIMQRFGIRKERGQQIKFLVRNHMFHYTDEWSDKAIRRFMKNVSRKELKDLIALRMADRKGSGKKTAFPKSLQKLIDHIDEVEMKETQPKVTDLEISGNDLQELGLKPGPEMGKILNQLLKESLEQGLENEREKLLKRADELLNAMAVHK